MRFRFFFFSFYNFADEKVAQRGEGKRRDVSNVTGSNYIPRKRAEPPIITAPNTTTSAGSR